MYSSGFIIIIVTLSLCRPYACSVDVDRFLKESLSERHYHLYVEGKDYMEDTWHHLTADIDKRCETYRPWQIIAATMLITAIILFLVSSVREFLLSDTSLTERVKKRAFTLAKAIPWVRRKIDAEKDVAEKGVCASLNKGFVGDSMTQVLPANGLSQEEVIRLVTNYEKVGSYDWKDGNVSGTVYCGDADLTQLTTKVYELSVWTNPLHADVFPGIRRMEAEVVRMCCNMFNGDADSCGTMSSGGTESILLACLAYRNRALEMGINRPEMLVSRTAHAAFDKAAHMYGMRIRHIEFDPVTMKVDVNKMYRAINRNVCMLVASAPHYPHGVMDDVVAIGKLGVTHNVPVHVDSCLGGFLIPFMSAAGYPLEPFDFRVRGVTSISCDTHKYGFAPKGSSVILYRSQAYRQHQFFTQPDWPGGVYASPTLAGSRPGSTIAGCWATMMSFGWSGYVDTTRKIMQARELIVKGLSKLEGLVILGEPKVSVVAFDSPVYDIYRLSSAMTNKGWHLNPLQYPAGVHICLTKLHTAEGVAQRFVDDMSECVREIMKDPSAKPTGVAAIYGMSQSIPDRSIVSDIATAFLNAYYSTSDKQQSNNNKNNNSQQNGKL